MPNRPEEAIARRLKEVLNEAKALEARVLDLEQAADREESPPPMDLSGTNYSHRQSINYPVLVTAVSQAGTITALRLRPDVNSVWAVNERLASAPIYATPAECLDWPNVGERIILTYYGNQTQGGTIPNPLYLWVGRPEERVLKLLSNVADPTTGLYPAQTQIYTNGTWIGVRHVWFTPLGPSA